MAVRLLAGFISTQVFLLASLCVHSLFFYFLRPKMVKIIPKIMYSKHQVVYKNRIQYCVVSMLCRWWINSIRWCILGVRTRSEQVDNSSQALQGVQADQMLCEPLLRKHDPRKPVIASYHSVCSSPSEHFMLSQLYFFLLWLHELHACLKPILWLWRHWIWM